MYLQNVENRVVVQTRLERYEDEKNDGQKHCPKIVLEHAKIECYDKNKSRYKMASVKSHHVKMFDVH